MENYNIGTSAKHFIFISVILRCFEISSPCTYEPVSMYLVEYRGYRGRINAFPGAERYVNINRTRRLKDTVQTVTRWQLTMID